VLQAAEKAINKMLNNDVYKRQAHLHELELAIEMSKNRIYELQQSAVDANVDLKRFGLAPEQLQVSLLAAVMRTALFHLCMFTTFVFKGVYKCS
jgi:hypothetical protein